ncbi:MAG: hypothetical protein WBA93_09755 [Microcoleaceae cyanobacterium]
MVRKLILQDAIKIPAMTEERTGYVAEDRDITYIVTGVTFTIVKNGKTMSEEEVIHSCSQFFEKSVKRGSRGFDCYLNKL